MGIRYEKLKYEEEGMYVNMSWIIDHGMAFNILIGTRGGGKTYGALKHYIRHHRPVDLQRLLFMRRTDTELDAIIGSQNSELDLSPFKALNRKYDRNFEMQSVKKSVGKIVEGEDLYGYAAALSTFSNIRGFDGTDVDTWIYDEFIPENHKRKIKNEGDAILNAYETINRNRELEGRKPLTAIFCANSNNFNHDLLQVLELTVQMEKMITKGKDFMVWPEKSLTISLVASQNFMEKKRNTVLYRLTEGTDFYRMALENDFAYNDFSNVKTLNLRGWKPYCSIGDIYIYRNGQNKYYASRHPHDKKHYEDTERGRSEFIAFGPGRLLRYKGINQDVFYETYQIKGRLMEDILK